MLKCTTLQCTKYRLLSIFSQVFKPCSCVNCQTHNPFDNHHQITPFYSFVHVILTKGSGLAKRTGLQKFGIEYNPTGFPMKKLDMVACPVHKDIQIPLHGSCAIISVTMPLSVWKLFRISVGRLHSRYTDLND